MLTSTFTMSDDENTGSFSKKQMHHNSGGHLKQYLMEVLNGSFGLEIATYYEKHIPRIMKGNEMQHVSRLVSERR